MLFLIYLASNLYIYETYAFTLVRPCDVNDKNEKISTCSYTQVRKHSYVNRKHYTPVEKTAKY